GQNSVFRSRHSSQVTCHLSLFSFSPDCALVPARLGEMKTATAGERENIFGDLCRLTSLERGRMEPRGRERHRWAKPRGRNEWERMSQALYVLSSVTISRSPTATPLWSCRAFVAIVQAARLPCPR